MVDGFPSARILVIFSLSVGTALEAAIGKYQGKQTGENSLFRGLYDVLAEGERLGKDDHLDAERYPPEEIALPYRRRWQAELHPRSLKIVSRRFRCRGLRPKRGARRCWRPLPPTPSATAQTASNHAVSNVAPNTTNTSANHAVTTNRAMPNSYRNSRAIQF